MTFSREPGDRRRAYQQAVHNTVSSAVALVAQCTQWHSLALIPPRPHSHWAGAGRRADAELAGQPFVIFK